MIDKQLLAAVEELARAGAGATDEALGRPWAWRMHEEGVRFAYLHSYQQLRELAATIASECAAKGPPPSAAQRILAQHHVGYRDLCGLLAGVEEEDAARAPAEGEWPLRDVVFHIARAEHGFFGVAQYSLDRARAGKGPEQPTGSPSDYHPEIDRTSSFAELLAAYDALHTVAMTRLAEATDAELDVPTLWWEEAEFPVAHRFFRFDAHLKQHAIQCEKTLDGIGRRPTEATRLIRLVYGALGAAEGAALGASAAGARERASLAAELRDRAREVAAVLA